MAAASSGLPIACTYHVVRDVHSIAKTSLLTLGICSHRHSELLQLRRSFTHDWNRPNWRVVNWSKRRHFNKTTQKNSEDLHLSNLHWVLPQPVVWTMSPSSSSSSADDGRHTGEMLSLNSTSSSSLNSMISLSMVLGFQPGKTNCSSMPTLIWDSSLVSLLWAPNTILTWSS